MLGVGGIEQKMKTFNLYCDESCHLENDRMPYFLLGYVSVPYNQMERHKDRIKAIKEKHHYYGEVKWNKVSKSQLDFYIDLIDYFFDSDLFFRAIVVNKAQIKTEEYGQDYDTFYYKMYYQLLYHRLDTLSHYNIYLDIKDTLSAKKVAKLKEILQTKFGVIRNLQNIRSHESIFLQLTDLIIGAINYHLRGEILMDAKKKIIDRIQTNSNHSLDRSTALYEPKLNLFFIDLE
jgi:hypothetical protein